jgi:hypothetical protein
VDENGPAGWLLWVIRTRNMLAHRPRRTLVFEAKLVPGTFAGPGLEIVPRLWRLPYLTDVEAWAVSGGPAGSLLREGAELTMARALRSVNAMVEQCSAALVELWRWRRANEDSLNQPYKKQLEDRADRSDDLFDGYFPELPPPAVDTVFTAPQMVRRIGAAHLTSDKIGSWTTREVDKLK